MAAIALSLAWVGAQLITGASKPKLRKLGWMDWFLEKTSIGYSRHMPTPDD